MFNKKSIKRLATWAAETDQEIQYYKYTDNKLFLTKELGRQPTKDEMNYFNECYEDKTKTCAIEELKLLLDDEGWTEDKKTTDWKNWGWGDWKNWE